MPEVAANSARDGFIDPRTLMQLRSLELRARIVVQGFWNGIHRSPYHGFSVEFTEYRQYVPGDDLRYVRNASATAAKGAARYPFIEPTPFER